MSVCDNINNLIHLKEVILLKWPGRQGKDYLLEMEAVVKDLESLALDAEARGVDPRECARNWRHLGDAYYDLCNGNDPEQVSRALAAYTQARTFMEGINDPLNAIELSCGYGKALYSLSRGRDLAILDAARREYGQALDAAMNGFPELVEPMQNALTRIHRLIALLEERRDLCEWIVARKPREQQLPEEDFDLDIQIPEDAALFARLLDVHHRAAQAFSARAS